MANKRMFSNSVIDSDEFALLSLESQLLYFHISMKCDDDGFVSTLKICKVLGLGGKELEELEKAGFIIRFDGGVVLIRHWKINNTLKTDRYHESRFASFKKQVRIDENGVYSMMEPEWNHSGTISDASIAQESPAQVSPEKESPAQVSPGEGGQLQMVVEVVKNRGIPINERVVSVIREECEKSSENDVIKKLITSPSFLKRLQLLGGIA